MSSTILTTNSILPHGFEKFDGSNYVSWKYLVKMLLIQGEVWDVVSGDAKAPEDGDDEKLKSWKKMDNKALATISLAIKPQYLQHITSSKSAKDAWEKMETVYQGKGIMRRIFLKKKLLRAEMQEEDDMQEHVYKFNGVLDELSAIGHPVEAEETVITLLCSLPKSWEFVIISIGSQIDKIS